MGVTVFVVVVVAVLVAVLLAVAAAMGRRQRSRSVAPQPPPAAAATPKAQRAEPAPMTGLEDALNRTTDRSGTTMADRLNAEDDAVEGLRVTDDTGPLLRRALDRFGQADAGAPDTPSADDAGEHSETRPPHTAE